ncbi:hypothetical protein P9D34_11015 [Bacillus swezeyi]|uniref:Uncharacterized protein n=1 Tax=Bacillus swezeyi TaxID=1925020 RepID=A0A1R1RZL6_9BACI|nr:hypothetical protein [Bacillus swezeyi]MEC1260978.1 hypothetical protein [Bacillus swezeyi]MED1741927.1 hypothetical protein [Bacillus swezeyi]MED2928915.1 hypothetical protein [Bacillus swezeyi]MED2942933.1 hypothetical protein [Bacillus swezeyi]MED2964437.1 hypothetical protein [Bacillus swezeyi]
MENKENMHMMGPAPQPQPNVQFPQYPQSEALAHHIKCPLFPHLKPVTLCTVAPFVHYGLNEAQATSYHHAMEEVAAMAYLMGMGMDPHTAYCTVESWEINEKFY